VTPLTAIALQIDRLRPLVDGAALDVVSHIAEHTGRLRRRIENLLAMARLEARNIAPRPEPTPAADLFRSIREHLPLVAQSRSLDVRVAGDCPDVYVDPSLALEILANLVENAHQAAPPHRMRRNNIVVSSASVLMARNPPFSRNVTSVHGSVRSG
jgi:two-component system sensor histidine kinase KdpD